MEPYTWTDYRTVGRRISNIGSGLLELGLKKGSFVALYMETRADWTLFAQSCFTQSIVVLTVYANLGEKALVHALTEAGVTHVFTSSDLIKSLSLLVSKIPTVNSLIYVDPWQAETQVVDSLKKSGVRLFTLEEVEKNGEKKSHPHNPPGPFDVALLMYTSGSTGMPKGVVVTHRNCMCAVAGVLAVYKLKSGDTHLSYLPLAHILAFILESGMLSKGVGIAYGNPRTLSDTSCKGCHGDLVEAAPNFIIGVPSVFDKIKAGILATIASQSSLAQAIFHQAYEAKRVAVAQGLDTPLLNLILFNSLKKKIGGNVRWIVSGGAPLSFQCAEFLRTVFGVPVNQGYGLTETCGGGSVGDPTDLDPSTAGAPICCTEFKLVDQPKMKYTSKDQPCPRGEIWIRGGQVAFGYYKLPDKTAEAFTKSDKIDDRERWDGWFKTGDIGRLNPNGTISIIDRIKNLIKPPHGEYVAIEHLEAVYKNSPLVANILVFATSNDNNVVALIQPNKVALQKLNLIEGSWENLCKSKEAVKAVLESLTKTWRENGLKPFEKIMNVTLFPEEWTPENGWLTAAMKIKRPEVIQDKANDLSKLYTEIGGHI